MILEWNDYASCNKWLCITKQPEGQSKLDKSKKHEREIIDMFLPPSDGMVISCDGGLGSLILILLFELTRNWYVNPGLKSLINWDVLGTYGIAACHTSVPKRQNNLCFSFIYCVSTYKYNK